MRLVVIPGVFAPISDTRLLADCTREHLRAGMSVLDVCTGSGAVAVAAALGGAGAVSATDISVLSVLNARLNARLNQVRIEVSRGDLFAPIREQSFDLIVANPPYVPSASSRLPGRGRARAWDGGRDGRVVIDRICAEGPAHLNPRGTLMIIHSSLCDGQATIERMHLEGLRAEIVARRRGPLGPLLSARAAAVHADGMSSPGNRDEELLVIGGRCEGAMPPAAI